MSKKYSGSAASLSNSVGKFLGCDATFDDAKIVLFGVPYDATSTYRKGSRLAPTAIRKESDGIETYSPYLDKDLQDIQIHDAGDILSLRGAKRRGNLDPAPMVYNVEAQTQKILDAGKFPIMLGGEHLVTLGAVRAVAKKYPDLAIVHFDAHADLRDDWDGKKLNHSTVMRRCHDVIASEAKQSLPSIYQYGIRSGTREEFAFIKKHILKDLPKGRPVYFTIDLDVLDPSEFGGTGTPEAGGVTFLELLAKTKEVFSTLNVVGCDINELCPPYDHNGASTALACKYLREVLLLIK